MDLRRAIAGRVGKFWGGLWDKAASFQSAPDDGAFHNRALRTEFPNGLKTASFAVSRVGIEWDNRLSLHAILTEKTLNGRRQLHPPGRKAQKHNIVLVDALDLCFQRRQAAGFILPGDLLHRGVVVGGPKKLDITASSRVRNIISPAAHRIY